MNRPHPGWLCAASLILLSAAAPALAQAPPSVDAIHARLARWASERPAETQRIEFGTSAGGRALVALRVAAPGPVDPDARPAVFVGANVAGYHLVGSQAALHLIEALLGGAAQPWVTFYVVPVLNPDAHDAALGDVRRLREGNDQPVDRDRDGEVGEDGVDDLDGDGRITWLRIPDPAGAWLPDPLEPRLLVEAVPLRGQRGAFRLETEGRDDDGDGAFNEDGKDGVFPDRNFAHGFVHADPDAGPWASYAPEARAAMDLLLARRNVALAVVYGPANTLLALPKGFDGQPPFGDVPLEIPGHLASRLGLTPGKPATLEQAWAAAKDLPFARARSLTKDELAQMLVRKPASAPAADDVKLLEELAKGYVERLKTAGQGQRPGRAYARGGLTAWLYYHYGVHALELDVWGVPKLEAKPPAAGADKGDEGDEGDEGDAPKPPADPEAQGSPELQRRREVLRYCAEALPGSVVPWKQVTLPDGTVAEVGGLDPLAEFTPPADQLAAALGAHTETILDLASRLARVELLSVELTPLGGGVSRLDVVAGNAGYLPTHTTLAVYARAHLPIRLELELGEGVSLLTGQRWRSAERLAGSTGTLRAEWLVRGPQGSTIDVLLRSPHAGGARHRVSLGGE